MAKPEARILVVEDEDAIRLSLRDYLIKEGFRVYVASDGVGAIKQLIDNDIDLIISDYKMDILGGDYWVKFLRRYCTDTAVIITSGFLRPEFEIPFEVVYKPFDFSDLKDRIVEYLARASEGRPSSNE